MHIIYILLLVALALAASSALHRFVPVPLPIVQVMLGALCGLPFIGLVIRLDPEMFLVLLVAPLLFADAWNSSKRDLAKQAPTILLLAFGLVIFTVVSVGLVLHWLIPSLALAVCFAIASVLSPTDAVAVQSITERVAVPSRLLHLIEGEALLNDATGLVALRFAIVMAMTGAFSAASASFEILRLSIGGILLGTFCGWIGTRLIAKLDRVAEQTTSLFALGMPVAVFILAEHLNVSGILAAVFAGAAGEVTSRRISTRARTRVVTSVLWSVMTFALNGTVFILLGMQIPNIVASAPGVAHDLLAPGPSVIALYVVALGVALLLFRFLWVAVVLLLRGLRQKTFRVWAHDVLVVTFAGVRGAVTLAAVLTLPLTLAPDVPFPGRSLAILLAAGTIVFSLVTSSIALPLLLRNVQPEGTDDAIIDHARVMIGESVAAALEVRRAALETGMDVRAMSFLADTTADIMRSFVPGGHDPSRDRSNERIAHELRRAAMDAARVELLALLDHHDIDEHAYRLLTSELDVTEATQGD